MKSATRSTIVIACILLVAALVYPPWVDIYTKEFLGFHFITGDDVENIDRAQIDYAKLAVLVLCISATVIATYLVATSSAAAGFGASLRRILHPLITAWGWLEKYWLWIALAVAVVKAAIHFTATGSY